MYNFLVVLPISKLATKKQLILYVQFFGHVGLFFFGFRAKEINLYLTQTWPTYWSSRSCFFEQAGSDLLGKAAHDQIWSSITSPSNLRLSAML